MLCSARSPTYPCTARTKRRRSKPAGLFRRRFVTRRRKNAGRFSGGTEVPHGSVRCSLLCRKGVKYKRWRILRQQNSIGGNIRFTEVKVLRRRVLIELLQKFAGVWGQSPREKPAGSYSSSFRSFSLIQPILRSKSPPSRQTAAGRIKQSRTRPIHWRGPGV